jgi:hypothetical protein
MTWHEVARRRWLEEQGEHPDKSPAKIIGDAPEPANSGVGNVPPSPVYPANGAATPEDVSADAAGSGGTDD